VIGDSLVALSRMESESVDLIMTSPPFGLVRKKDYGNVDANEYVKWFKPFGEQFRRVLRPTGSLVIDIGGAWIPGQPTRSLYHFKLLIMLCDEVGFHLAQEFHWWNPSKLPTPAEWVTVRRIRVKDAVNSVWWLSPTPWPKASNRRVLQPYSASMRELLRKGYKAKKRPSGHDISEKFSVDNGAAIPPNLIAVAHTDSNSYYQRYCRAQGLPVHPARFPAELPEFFIRMLTDRGDLVVDPFAGSGMTGDVCERLNRKWMCIELEEDYVKGAAGRFIAFPNGTSRRRSQPSIQEEDQGQLLAKSDEVPSAVSDNSYYKLPHPGILWNGVTDAPLQADGGRTRPNGLKRKASKQP
jgi:DNA modification methylase